jgi:hypothetical protein
MEKIIQLLHQTQVEASAFAWLALGILLPVCIIMGMMTLFWIFTGGLRARSMQELLAEQREIRRWLKDDGL